MTTLRTERHAEKTASLEIVWRNPNPVSTNRRRHSFEPVTRCYIQQEFVYDGRLGYWMTLSDLEIVVGGRAA
ncbi:MAG TPA: hypothetical protein VEG30_04555 [Terriglobales bacterium]|nr:hypothetical protein [Terriglobales bacterium]